MGKGTLTVILLFIANSFMTMAWYGHLKFNYVKSWGKWSILGLILISWGIAFVEYCFQVPANRLGYKAYGGPYSLVQLKVIQEIVTLMVFVGFSVVFFKNETFKLNHFIAFIFLVLAVFFIFKD